MVIVRLALFLCFITSSLIAFPATITTESTISEIGKCLQSLQKQKESTDNSINDTNIVEFGTCIKQAVNQTKLKNELLIKNDLTDNFTCCLNSLTLKLVAIDSVNYSHSNQRSFNISKYAQDMIGCAIRGPNSQQTGPILWAEKITWLLSMPNLLKKDITDHIQCYRHKNRSPVTDGCCASEYHNKVEVQLISDYLHKAMLCMVDPTKNETECRNEWYKSINRSHCIKNTQYRTKTAKDIMQCSSNQTYTMEDIIGCILYKALPTLPSHTFRSHYCYERYAYHKSSSLFVICMFNRRPVVAELQGEIHEKKSITSTCNKGSVFTG